MKVVTHKTAAVTVTRETRALTMLSNSCGGSKPRNTPEVIEHAVAFLSGVYGARFQPASNTVLAWCALFEDALPEDVAEAVRRYVSNPDRDDSGRLTASFPPSAADILAIVREFQAERERRERRLYTSSSSGG